MNFSAVLVQKLGISSIGNSGAVHSERAAVALKSLVIDLVVGLNKTRLLNGLVEENVSCFIVINVSIALIEHVIIIIDHATVVHVDIVIFGVSFSLVEGFDIVFDFLSCVSDIDGFGASTESFSFVL